MEKLYKLHQKHCAKWLVGEGIPLILPPPGHKLLQPSISLPYFSHLALLILLFVAKRQS